MSYSAASNAFSIPELLHRVPSCLQSHDLLAASRVSKSFRAVITESSYLQRSLSRGPKRHWLDRAATEWKVGDLKFTWQAHEWQHQMLWKPVGFEAIEDVSFGKDARDQLGGHLLYHAGPVLPDTMEDQGDIKPIDFIDKDFSGGSHDYLTDPPTPMGPMCDYIPLQNIVDPRAYRKYAYLEVSLPIMTVVDIVDVAKALTLSPPKALFESEDNGPKQWCPQEYPELVNTPVFRHAISALQGQDVVYKVDHSD